jgi:hypothetical protein
MLYVRVLRQYELIGNVDNARVSAHGVDLVSLTDPTLLLFGSTADAFDPTSTGAKTNRGGMWCLFGSFATPQGDAHSGCNTFLIAVGPSKVTREWIDTTMHQELFLGVARTVCKDHVGWFKLRSKGLPCLKVFKNPNETADNLRLSWAKARPVPETGTFSGNVSENFLWLARGSKWLHVHTPNLPASDAKHQDPDRSYEDFTVKMIKAWHSNRNLPCDKEAAAEDVRTDFQEHLESLGSREPPPIVESKSQNVPVGVLDELVVSQLRHT